MASPGSMAASMARSCLQSTSASLAFTPALRTLTITLAAGAHIMLVFFLKYEAAYCGDGNACSKAARSCDFQLTNSLNACPAIENQACRRADFDNSFWSGRSPGISSAIVMSARQRSACSIACASVVVTALHTSMLDVSAASAGPAPPCGHGLTISPPSSAPVPARVCEQCILIRSRHLEQSTSLCCKKGSHCIGRPAALKLACFPCKSPHLAAII